MQCQVSESAVRQDILQPMDVVLAATRCRRFPVTAKGFSHWLTDILIQDMSQIVQVMQSQWNNGGMKVASFQSYVATSKAVSSHRTGNVVLLK